MATGRMALNAQQVEQLHTITTENLRHIPADITTNITENVQRLLDETETERDAGKGVYNNSVSQLSCILTQVDDQMTFTAHFDQHWVITKIHSPAVWIINQETDEQDKTVHKAKVVLVDPEIKILTKKIMRAEQSQHRPKKSPWKWNGCLIKPYRNAVTTNIRKRKFNRDVAREIVAQHMKGLCKKTKRVMGSRNGGESTTFGAQTVWFVNLLVTCKANRRKVSMTSSNHLEKTSSFAPG